MRLKILSLFVGLQLIALLAWQGLAAVQAADTPPTGAPRQEVTHAAADSAFDRLRFSARHLNAAAPDAASITEADVLSILRLLPESHVRALEQIILDHDPQAHRGLGGSGLVIVRATRINHDEALAVLIHEIGHNVDLENPGFHRISWNSETTLKLSAGNLDFVSGYAMTDPFEDFAETYAFYVLHNSTFRSLAASSPALYAKYAFMRDTVFNGKTFETGEAPASESWRPWDVTVLGYSLSLG